MLTRFSYSSLGTFRNCPQQFKFEKIDKVDVPKRFFAHTHLGSAVHRQLKTAYQWAVDGKLYPLETMLERYDGEWNEPIKKKIIPAGEHLTVDDSIESGRKMLTTFYERYQPFDQGVLLGAEMNLNFELPSSRFRFTARIDRLLKRDDGVVEICDYKTGRQLPAGADTPGFRRQMGLYQLAVQSAFPQFEQIELAQYYLKHDEVLRYRMRPDQLDELAEQFRSDVLATIDAERRSDWPPKESGLCDFCDYVHLCPAKRHRLALKAEEDDDRSSLAKASELADRFAEANDAYNRLKAEREALRQEIIQTARGLSLTKLVGSGCDILVRTVAEDKLPTKTSDAGKFADLTFLVRQWGLEECFSLDGRVLLRDFFKRGRLTESQAKELEEYITRSERSTVSVKKCNADAEDD